MLSTKAIISTSKPTPERIETMSAAMEATAAAEAAIKHHNLIAAMLQQQTLVLSELQDLRLAISEHIAKEERAIDSLIAAMPRNPDGTPDVTGHRDYHTAAAEAARERADLFREAKRDILRRGWRGLFALLSVAAIWLMGKHNGIL